MKLTLILFYVSCLVAKQVAIYWGQNVGGDERNLASYCKDKTVDIIIISYLNEFDGRSPPKIKFETQCHGQWCTEIGADITECQKQGKKVLLSLGGPKGLYNLGSLSYAENFAQQIWKMFFIKNDPKLILGEVSLDGIDLSIENLQGTFYKEFIDNLRSISKSAGKNLFISASPGCKMPSTSMDDVLENTELDMVFVKFYNDNSCESDQNINIDQWNQWAIDKKTWLFIGVAGSERAVKSGYMPLADVKRRIQTISQHYKSYGGIALLDADTMFDDTKFAIDLASLVHSKAYISSIQHLALFIILTYFLFL